MQASTVDMPASATLPVTRYGADLAAALAGAVMGTAGIVLLFNEPLPSVLFMALLLAVLLWRWHTTADLLGLALGVTLGNLTEFLCDAFGVWIHATNDVAGVAPPYIFICYPILWLTVPRLMDALVRRPRPRDHGAGNAPAIALALWAAHLGLSCVYGTNNQAELVVCVVILALTLWRFHDAHDIATALFGGFLGLVWEIPATTSGAWHFPHPQLMGLIPAWLPLAYAIFFVNLSRVHMALVRRWRA